MQDRPTTSRRTTKGIAGALVLVIALGLASRKVPGMFPAVLANYPGDALWAVALFLCIALVRPRMRMRIWPLALGVAWTVECAQLIQYPPLVALRATTLGHLVLGSGFDWFDLLAYAVGIAVAAPLYYYALGAHAAPSQTAPVNTGG